MLRRIRKAISDRRRTLGALAGIAAAAYLAREYALDRWREFRASLVDDIEAKDTLRRKFEQTRADCAFAVEALLPTFGEQILAPGGMDVEGLTGRLGTMRRSVVGGGGGGSSGGEEGRGRAGGGDEVGVVLPTLPGATPSEERPPPLPPTDSPPTLHSLPQLDASTSDTAHSWITEFQQRDASLSPSGYSASISNSNSNSNVEDQDLMLASVTSAGTTGTGAGSELSVGGSSERSVGSGSGVDGSGVFVPSLQVESSDEASGSDDRPHPHTRTRAAAPTKSELWEEVKILSFTRTLTIIYTISLLTLLTRIQLNVLSRRSYLSSLRKQARLLRMQHAPVDLVGEMWTAWVGRGVREWEEEEEEWEEEGEGETERAYVMFSWWVLNVGWKEVGERVRRGVEDVLGPVSLKTHVGPEDVERLVEQVRRRVEVALPGEPFPFASTLLPPTPTSQSHLLTSNRLPPNPTPLLTSLLSETSAWLSAPGVGDVWGEVVSQGVGEWMGVLGGEEGGRRVAEVCVGMGRWGREGVLGMPNRLVEAMNGVRELTGLGALVFGYGLEEGVGS